MQEVISPSILSRYSAVIEKPTGKLPNLNGKQVAVFCDFDGTISVGDVVDILLEELADPQWRVIEKRWENGEIDDCECMSQQIALIRGTWDDIVKVLDKIEIDPDFKSFVELCNQANIPIYIGSNGLDRVIKHFLVREGIKVKDIWSYQLSQSNNQWSLMFAKGQHRSACITPNSPACKCALVDIYIDKAAGAEGIYPIVIGDSKSDFCWVRKADFVFAKSKLAKHCHEEQIDYVSFKSFADINDYLASDITK